MAKEKWTPSTRIEKALARIEQQSGKTPLPDWGNDEHGALVRYVVLDALAEVPSVRKAQGETAKGKADADILNGILKEAFATTSIWEQSNFKKRLTECGRVKGTATAYE